MEKLETQLRHLHVCGYLTEVRVCNPYKTKLDWKQINGYFIGNAKRFKGYNFTIYLVERELLNLRMQGFLRIMRLMGAANLET